MIRQFSGDMSLALSVYGRQLLTKSWSLLTASVYVHAGSHHFYRPFSSSLKRFQERKFTESHEWILISSDKSTVTVGISDYAQNSLGDIVFVELPEVGAEIEKGNECGLVESVKSVSNIYSPVSGEVILTNEALLEQSQLINSSPLDEGWIVKLKPTKLAEESVDLMDEEQYSRYLAAEEENTD